MCHCQSLQAREDLTRANTEGSPQDANEARLDFAKKHLKKPEHFWKSVLWTVESKINRYQNKRKKKVWRSLGTSHDQKNLAYVIRKHGEAVWWHKRAWLPVALGYWCLVMTWQKIEAAGWILKCIGIYCLSRFSQMEERIFFYILQWPSQSPDFSPIEHAFHLLKTKLKAERPTNKQQLKSSHVHEFQT